MANTILAVTSRKKMQVCLSIKNVTSKRRQEQHYFLIDKGQFVEVEVRGLINRRKKGKTLNQAFGITGQEIVERLAKPSNLQQQEREEP